MQRGGPVRSLSELKGASKGRPGGLPIGKQLAPLRVTSPAKTGAATSPLKAMTSAAAKIVYLLIFIAISLSKVLKTLRPCVRRAVSRKLPKTFDTSSLKWYRITLLCGSSIHFLNLSKRKVPLLCFPVPPRQRCPQSLLASDGEKLPFAGHSLAFNQRVNVESSVQRLFQTHD